MGREVEMQSCQEPNSKVGDTQMKRTSPLQRSSLRSKRSETHVGLPILEVLHWEDKPPERLALKTSGDSIQERWRAIGKRLHS